MSLPEKTKKQLRFTMILNFTCMVLFGITAVIYYVNQTDFVLFLLQAFCAICWAAAGIMNLVRYKKATK